MTAPSTALALVGLDKDVIDLVRTSPDFELVGVFAPADPGADLTHLGGDRLGRRCAARVPASRSC